MAHEIKGVDNRGTEEVPFGYVYVDDTRVGFAGDSGTWPTHNWPSTDAQAKAAADYLDKHMPSWRDVKVDKRA
jgi:hypothetical protein